MSSNKVSFSKVAGTGHSAPVAPPSDGTPTEESNAQLVPQPGTEAAVQQQQPSRGLSFYTGAEEETDAEASDIRTPRLNLIQGLSKPELKAIGPDGTFVYKKTIALPKTFRAVICGRSKKLFIEKLAQNADRKPRTFSTLEEVLANGGTDKWYASKWCLKDDVPVSKLPYFEAHVTFKLLIEKPEGFDESNFPIKVGDKRYGPALYTVKGIAYDFFVAVNSELHGAFESNLSSKVIVIGSTLKKAWAPTLSITSEKTSPELIAAARSQL